MSRYFSFRCEVKLPQDDYALDVLVITQGLQAFDPSDLTTVLERSLEQTSLPDYLVLLVSQHEFEAAANACATDTALKAALERGKTIWSRHLLGIDGFGKRSGQLRLGGTRPLDDANLSAVLRATFQSGLEYIAKKQEVVKFAPPGCVFSKPSGDISGWFLLAADLLHVESEIAFIAMVVLARFGETLDEVRTIYIDTMAMQPLARAVIALGQANGRSLSPSVESFHSYEGLAALQAESPNRIVCLMSASTSGALARKFIERTRCGPDRVLICLDVVDDRDGSGILINAKKLFRLDVQEHKRRHHGAARVQLAGEFFASTARPPRSVVLAAKHAVSGLSDRIQSMLLKNVLTLDYAAPGAKLPRAIAVDGTALLQLEPFKKWLRRRIGWSVPVSVRWIIHADDPVSAELAKSCREILRERGIAEVQEILNAADLAARQPVADESGVLVVSAVVRSGTQLSSISRDLRTFAPASPRVYIVGIALPTSQSSYKIAESNLRKGLGDWNYSVETWASIPVGHVDSMSSWDEERDLLSSIETQADEGEFLNWVRTRFRALSSTGTSNSSVKFNGTTSEGILPLRPGFIYLGKEDALEDPAAVYTIVAATLQNAREGEGLPARDRLSSSDFEQVVISPECFNRFNDGLIQASLLRCAYVSELDYSCSNQLSAEIARIVRKFLLQHKQERGEAALEFALALATGRLRLDQRSGAKLFDQELLSKVSDVPSLYGLLQIAKERYAIASGSE